MKDLERQSKKSEKQEKLEKAKAKKAIAAGNVDVARIHAENAIRQKNQKVNYLRMSARVDAVASRVQSALTTRNVSDAGRCSCQSSVKIQIPLISMIIIAGDIIDDWCCTRHGCSHEGHEFGKDFVADG